MTSSLWPLTLASIENFTLINGALSVVSFIVVWFVRRTERVRGWHPLMLSRLYAAALVVPPVASAWLVIASFAPRAWIEPGRWAQEHQSQHTLHLLNALTVPLDPLLGYAALAFAFVAALVAAYAGASAYFRIGGVVRRLGVGSEPAAPERIKQVEDACKEHGIDVGLVVSSYPFSFVWGYLRSKLVVSTGLLNALTSRELGALLEHEAAHHARRDNVSKWLLTICRYASPAFPLTVRLYRWWNGQVEMICDEIAARRTSGPAEVAGALTRLKRLTLAGTPLGRRSTESGFLGERGRNFEQRVMRVLSLRDEPEATGRTALTRSWFRFASLTGLLVTLSLAVLFVVSPLAVHRAIEAVLCRF